MELKELLGRSLVNEISAYNIIPSIDAIKTLLTLGADIDYVNDSGYTALMMSIFKDDCSIMNLLIKAGADLDKQSNKKSTVLISVVHNLAYERTGYAKTKNKESLFRSKTHFEQLKILIKAGANLDIQSDSLINWGLTHVNNQTALMIASDHGMIDVVELLINSGANLTLKDNAGHNFIDLSSRKLIPLFKRYDFQKLLLSKEPTLYGSLIKRDIKIDKKIDIEFSHLNTSNSLNLL